jgi:hypothetical protein
MRAAIFHAAHQPMTIETLEVAKPLAHEVLLRTAYAGQPPKLPTPLAIAMVARAASVGTESAKEATWTTPTILGPIPGR